MGKHILLIRWRRNRDDWEAQYAAGRVTQNDPTTWRLDVDGTETVYDKGVWALYRE